MKRLIPITTVIALAGAAQAQPPASPPGFLGAWSCASEDLGMTVLGDVTFHTDGKVIRIESGAMDMGERRIEVTSESEGAWKIRPDGNLEMTTSSMKTTSARFNGRELPPSLLAALPPPVMEEAEIAAYALKDNSFVLTNQLGYITSCKRPA